MSCDPHDGALEDSMQPGDHPDHAPKADFTKFPIMSLSAGVEEFILAFLSAREIAKSVVFVNKWFREAVHYRWRCLESDYERRFRTAPLPIYLVASEAPPLKVRLSSCSFTRRLMLNMSFC